jgi:hypothetical protein
MKQLWKKWQTNKEFRTVTITLLLVVIIVVFSIWLIAITSNQSEDASSGIIDTYSECVEANKSEVTEDQCVTKDGVIFTNPEQATDKGKTDSAGADTTDKNANKDETSVPDETFPESSYLVIEQWDIKGPIDFSVLGEINYTIDKEVLTLQSARLDAILPSPCEGVGPNSWGVRRTTEVTDKKIGNYYYAQIAPSAGCSAKKDQLDPIKAAFEEFFNYLIAT